MVEWFNGKKTVIGAVCGWLALNLPGLFDSVGMADVGWLPTVVNVLNWAATILLPVGLTHKVVKAKVPPTGT